MLGKARATRRYVDGRILLAFLVAASALLALLALASEVSEGETLAFDRYLLIALRSPNDLSVPAGPDWLTATMMGITAIGGVADLTVLTAIVAGFLLVSRKTAMAAFVVGAVGGGALVGNMLKSVFHRSRPEIVAHLVEVHSLSFPSGHAMNSAVVYLTLGALLARSQAARAMRIYILAVSILLTLLIGISRVYLGVHWPSDVLAGWIVGAAWATMCSIVARMLQTDRKIEPPTAAPAQAPSET